MFEVFFIIVLMYFIARLFFLHYEIIDDSVEKSLKSSRKYFHWKYQISEISIIAILIWSFILNYFIGTLYCNISKRIHWTRVEKRRLVEGLWMGWKSMLIFHYHCSMCYSSFVLNCRGESSCIFFLIAKPFYNDPPFQQYVSPPPF